MDPTRQREMEDRRHRVLKKYIQSVPLQERFPKAEVLEKLLEAGLIDDDFKLTDAGQLRMHQLQLLEWMKKHAHNRCNP
jgi:hypothetical protein